MIDDLIESIECGQEPGALSDEEELEISLLKVNIFTLKRQLDDHIEQEEECNER